MKNEEKKRSEEMNLISYINNEYRRCNCEQMNIIDKCLNEELFTFNLNSNVEYCLRCENINICKEYVNRLRMKIINFDYKKESNNIISTKNIYKMNDDQLSTVKLNSTCEVRLSSDNKKRRKIEKKYLDCVDVISI